MKELRTHIVLLIDRSGSMTSIKKDMEGGLKEFIDKQKLESGKCTITAAQFDYEYDLIYKMKNLQEVVDIIIEPRGSTALIDSMCRLIDEVGNDLANLSESERPDKVLFITITDGEENASREFTSEILKEKIKHQEEVYKWSFTYIGANQDAFSVSRNLGVKGSSTLNFNASDTGSAVMFASLTTATSRYRSSTTTDAFNYTAQEQETTENTK
jgi:uncharacterized protein YegL